MIEQDRDLLDRSALRLRIHEVCEDEVEGQDADVHGVANSMSSLTSTTGVDTYYLH